MDGGAQAMPDYELLELVSVSRHPTAGCEATSRASFWTSLAISIAW